MQLSQQKANAENAAASKEKERKMFGFTGAAWG